MAVDLAPDGSLATSPALNWKGTIYGREQKEKPDEPCNQPQASRAILSVASRKGADDNGRGGKMNPAPCRFGCNSSDWMARLPVEPSGFKGLGAPGYRIVVTEEGRTNSPSGYRSGPLPI
jgi:hypothetical protein